MENQYFAASAVFLIQTLFGLYILAVMLRLLLQWVRADFYNPISQFLVKVTNPPLRPLRRVIPGWGGIDLASVLLLIVLEMIEQFLINTALGQAQPFPGLALNAVIALLDLLLNIYIFGIIIQAILSWVAPTSYIPAVSLIHSLTEPLLAPARRFIPAISGIDLSPIAVLLLLQLTKMLILTPLADLGRHLGCAEWRRRGSRGTAMTSSCACACRRARLRESSPACAETVWSLPSSPSFRAARPSSSTRSSSPTTSAASCPPTPAAPPCAPPSCSTIKRATRPTSACCRLRRASKTQASPTSKNSSSAGPRCRSTSIRRTRWPRP